MQELFNYGFSDSDIKELLINNKELLDLTKEEVQNKIDILLNIGCTIDIIKNIIISNPFYLNRMDKDLINLINKLYSLDIYNLNLLFDSNPFLLNKEVFEIDEFINKKLSIGMNLDDIIDIIESNSFEMDE